MPDQTVHIHTRMVREQTLQRSFPCLTSTLVLFTCTLIVVSRTPKKLTHFMLGESNADQQQGAKL